MLRHPKVPVLTLTLRLKKNLPQNPLVSFLLLRFSLSLPEKIPVPQSLTDPTFQTDTKLLNCSQQHVLLHIITDKSDVV